MSDNNQTYKADNGKTRLDLVSPTFIEAVGKIRTFGVQKYGDSDSWAKVEPKRYMAALLRHINAYRMGEETDKESGMPHLWHAACNLMFLIDLDKQALENRCKNCGNCVNYDGVRCSIDNVPCSSDDFCGHHELKISKDNTPTKEKECMQH